MSEIQKNCNRAAIIREGRIIACDTVDGLAKANAKRISVQGMITAEDLSKLEDVRDIKETNIDMQNANVDARAISFLYGGKINDLVGFLADFDILDINVTEPDLEDIFMHYYEGGE